MRSCRRRRKVSACSHAPSRRLDLSIVHVHVALPRSACEGSLSPLLTGMAGDEDALLSAPLPWGALSDSAT
eukprot:COSAG03_NODE_10181_length_666_cov_1.608466_1_plen_70_part_10